MNSPDKPTPTGATSATIPQINHEFPPGLELLGQLEKLSPMQALTMAHPEVAEICNSQNPEAATALFAGLFSGVGINLGVSIPEWAKKASQKGWQAWGIDFFKELQTPTPDSVGKLVELANIIQQSAAPNLGEQILVTLSNYIKSNIGELSAEELKKYAEGRLATPKMVEKAKNPSERALVFMSIAVHWQEVEKLGSHAKTHQWLLDNRIISPLTDRAETSKFFREIDLPKGKAGRPKKNTDCSENQ
jgi:hypothetical protein